MPVPAHCYVVLADSEEPDPSVILLKDHKTISFHYFHPNVPEALMYPRVPSDPTGRASLEWYQISAMRYRNPAMATYSEMGDIWDKFDNLNEDAFLDKEDYQKILVALNNNILAKGEGKRNVNWRAINRPNEQRDWDSAEANTVDNIISERGPASSRDAPIPPATARAEMHPYLEDKGKGKGKQTRTLHRESWNRRTHPRGLRVDVVLRAAGAAATAEDLDNIVEQAASTHTSMPDLVEDENEDEDEEPDDEQTMQHVGEIPMI